MRLSLAIPSKTELYTYTNTPQSPPCFIFHQHPYWYLIDHKHCIYFLFNSPKHRPHWGLETLMLLLAALSSGPKQCPAGCRHSIDISLTSERAINTSHRVWWFWTVVLEKTLESPLDCKEIQPVHPKGDQSWVFIGRTDVEAETPILWPPDAKSWLIWKDHDAGKDWWQEEKGTTEDEMVGWHHRLNGHEFK